MNIVITGGGTGGHVYPALSVAQYIKYNYKEHKVLYIGTLSGFEYNIIKDYDIEYAGVSAASMSKIFSIDGLKAVYEIGMGVSQAKRILDKFDADVVFGTGGYVSAPVYFAQQSRRKPIVIHEQNAIGGKSNKQISHAASKICITFQGAESSFPKEKTILTGLPVRAEFKSNYPKKEFADQFHIDKNKFTIFVCGGSQGAMSVNKAVLDFVRKTDTKDIQIIHQTGRKNLQYVLDNMPNNPNISYNVFDFVDMPKALNCADLVISRAGASTINEILCSKVPSILVPFPHAAENHQYYNAKSCVDGKASLLIEDKNLSFDTLDKNIKSLMDKSVLENMKKNAESIFIDNAASKISEIILDSAK